MTSGVSKASAFGQEGDKRNTKYVGAYLGGSAAGSAVGRQVGARSAGTTPGAVRRGVVRRAGFNMAPKTHGGLGMEAGAALGRAAQSTPGVRSTIKGGKIGGAIGAVGAVGAYAMHRKSKRAAGIQKGMNISAFGVQH